MTKGWESSSVFDPKGIPKRLPSSRACTCGCKCILANSHELHAVGAPQQLDTIVHDVKHLLVELHIDWSCVQCAATQEVLVGVPVSTTRNSDCTSSIQNLAAFGCSRGSNVKRLLVVDKMMASSSPYCSLCVADLSKYCSDEELGQLFLPFGPIASAKIVQRNDYFATGLVTLTSYEAAEVAKGRLDGCLFMGNRIRYATSLSCPLYCSLLTACCSEYHGPTLQSLKHLLFPIRPSIPSIFAILLARYAPLSPVPPLCVPVSLSMPPLTPSLRSWSV